MPSLSFVGQPKHNAVGPDPVPALTFGVTLNLTGIDRQQAPYVVLDRDVTVVLGGIYLPNVRFEIAPSVGQYFGNDTSVGFNITTDLYRYLIDAIESRRSHDLPAGLHFGIVMGRPGAPPERVGASFDFKFSEHDWTEVLGKLGYTAGWTAYIERGRIEGWTEVAGHISKAHERLLARDPTGVLNECRAAIRGAEKVVVGDWTNIAAQIDRGSVPVAGYKNKSERVGALREWVLKMADTGAHAETYNATVEDAEFVYGLTVDLLAYLSRKEAHAERARTT
jgi:hypothetical protein